MRRKALPCGSGLSLQVSARWRLGGDLGGAAHGAARTARARRELERRRSRQPIAEVGGKRGGKDDAVGYDLRIEIVKRSDDMTGFVVLPPRWVVERTFSWFGRNRRLAKDYENLDDTLLAFVTLASIQLALRRLARG